MEHSKNRYPGTRPFLQSEERLFFGREDDIARLIRIINLRNTLTLYGDSGVGKSSIIEAGLQPLLKMQGYIPINVRFGSYNTFIQKNPVSFLIDALPKESFEQSFLGEIEELEPSVWQLVKNLQVQKLIHEQRNPFILFIFDQFEELFTHPYGVKDFAKVLSTLINDAVPRSFRKQLDLKREGLSKEEWEYLDTPLEVKLIFSIRSDKMSLLDKISPQLPTILQNRIELEPLNRQQASRAIVAPALFDGDFDVPSFSFETEALDAILDYLSKGKNRSVEPFQLQLICQHIEEGLKLSPLEVQQEALPLVRKEDLPKLDDLMGNYYSLALEKIQSVEDRQVARSIIEEMLILEEEERRLTVDGGQIKRAYDPSDSLLDKLVSLRLLKSESNQQQVRSYELSHDSLIKPILHYKNQRIKEEEKQRIAEESKKQFENNLKRLGVLFLILLLGTVGIYSFFLNRQNDELKDINAQLWRAFNELEGFTRSDAYKDYIQEKNPLLLSTDITLELEQTRLDIQDIKGRIQEYREYTDGLREGVLSGKVKAIDVLNFAQSSQDELDSMMSFGNFLQVEPYKTFTLPDSSLGKKERARIIERLFVEAERLEELKKYKAAFRKYDQILAWEPANQKAIAARKRLEKILFAQIPANYDSQATQRVDSAHFQEGEDSEDEDSEEEGLEDDDEGMESSEGSYFSENEKRPLAPPISIKRSNLDVAYSKKSKYGYSGAINNIDFLLASSRSSFVRSSWGGERKTTFIMSNDSGRASLVFEPTLKYRVSDSLMAEVKPNGSIFYRDDYNRKYQFLPNGQKIYVDELNRLYQYDKEGKKYFLAFRKRRENKAIRLYPTSRSGYQKYADPKKKRLYTAKRGRSNIYLIFRKDTLLFKKPGELAKAMASPLEVVTIPYFVNSMGEKFIIGRPKAFGTGKYEVVFLDDLEPDSSNKTTLFLPFSFQNEGGISVYKVYRKNSRMLLDDPPKDLIAASIYTRKGKKFEPIDRTTKINSAEGREELDAIKSRLTIVNKGYLIKYSPNLAVVPKLSNPSFNLNIYERQLGDVDRAFPWGRAIEYALVDQLLQPLARFPKFEVEILVDGKPIKEFKSKPRLTKNSDLSIQLKSKNFNNPNVDYYFSFKDITYKGNTKLGEFQNYHRWKSGTVNFAEKQNLNLFLNLLRQENYREKWKSLLEIYVTLGTVFYEDLYGVHYLGNTRYDRFFSFMYYEK